MFNLEDYLEIFTDDLGTIQQFKAQLEDVKPGFFKPRSVTIIEDELDLLEQIGVLEKVSYSE